jgi:DNA-binding CsgD family transcriptional regulator
LTALVLAEEHGNAAEALRVAGRRPDTLGSLSLDTEALLAQMGGDTTTEEAVALGFLAGRVAHSPHVLEVSSFLMDRDLVVCGAHGRSVLQLPWFDDDLFVARQLPDIREMPDDVRNLAVRHYRAALGGERGRFEFTSFGHCYSVDSIPVRGKRGEVTAVLGMARPRAGSGAKAPLTPREIELLQLAADGLSGPQIAELLVLSPSTVKTHFENIYRKVGVSDRAGAVAKGMRQGLIR